MNKSIIQIELQIISLSSLSSDFVTDCKNKNCQLFISTEIDDVIQEAGSPVLSNSNRYDFKSGSLLWNVESDRFSNIKALQPKLKLQITMKVKNELTSKSVGFAFIDLRDIGRNKQTQILKVHNMKNAELAIKVNSTELLHIPQPAANASNVLGGSHAEGYHLGEQSIESDPTDDLYDLTFSMAEFVGFAPLAQALRDLTGRDLCLNWQLFGQKFQSKPFGAEDSPRPVLDVFQVQCPPQHVLQHLAAQLPLRIHLCPVYQESNVLASAEVNYDLDTVIQTALSKDTADKDFRLKCEGKWATLVLTASIADYLSAPDSFKEDACIKVELGLSKHVASSVSSIVETAESAFLKKEVDATVENRTYEYDFEEEYAIPGSTDSQNVNSNASGGAAAAVDTPESDYLHHYRMSVDLKTIMHLKRPSHISLSYSYPYLGANTNTVVRTPSAWILPHIEARVDGGAATFDCCFTGNQFEHIISHHAFKIYTHSKSSLGASLLGETEIDLSYIFSTPPVSYRCLLTSKTFHTLDEYRRHRALLVALRAAGRANKIPPLDPVRIHAVDSYYAIAPVDSDHSAVEGAKVRVLVVIEDLGRVGPEIGVPVRPGYKQHSAGVYESEVQDLRDAEIDEPVPEKRDSNLFAREDLSTAERARLESLQLDWDAWQRSAESKWREAMKDRETQLRQKLEAENTKKLLQQTEDLKYAQAETGKLEIRLRETIDAVERQKSQLLLKEEQMNMRLAQKTAELQLFQKRVRDEAKIKIDVEVRRNEQLDHQINTLHAQLEQAEKRYKEIEYDFDLYRKKIRNAPESALREEVARLRAQLAESRSEAERERRLQSETKLEEEKLRAQLHKIALALKRERDRSSVLARQDLEQLKLEFLAREERHVLDGDREELRNIKNELAALRLTVLSSSPHKTESSQAFPSSSSTFKATSNMDTTGATLAPQDSPQEKPPSRGTDEEKNRRVSLTSELPEPSSETERVNESYSIGAVDQSFLSTSDSELIEVLRDLPPPQPHRMTVDTSEPPEVAMYLSCISELNHHLNELASTGRYTDGDPAVIALKQEKEKFYRLIQERSQQ